jgi:hypothetical protein
MHPNTQSCKKSFVWREIGLNLTLPQLAGNRIEVKDSEGRRQSSHA